MGKRAIELSRLTVKGQCTLPRRIRDYFGVGPGDHAAFVVAHHGVLVKKLVVREETPSEGSPVEVLQQLVLAIGREAQAHGLTEEGIEQDIDRYLKRP
jgi:bifunctional DNA-binding transcriptional regulator/antitoxin component of YhaV-PrlF toxin-antitoxin module